MQKLVVDSFDFQQGFLLANKYEVISKLGQGWEGEVYVVRENVTGIIHAAKFFFPQRNIRNRALKYYAKKLYKLRHCPILIQYHTQETIKYCGVPLTFLVSEYVEGELLSEFLLRQPGKRLSAFKVFICFMRWHQELRAFIICGNTMVICIQIILLSSDMALVLILNC